MLKFVKKGLGDPKPFSVRELLHKSIPGWEPARSHEVVHASDLTDHEFCPRQYALLDLTEKQKKGKYVSTAQRVAYAFGYFTQSKVTDWLRDKVWGDWQCTVCGVKQIGKKMPVYVCQCGVKSWQYREINVVSKEHGVSGGVDLLLEMGPGTPFSYPKLRLVEVKSIDKDEFKELKAPLALHRKRTALYLQLAALSDHPLASSIDPEEATILYVSKSFGFKDEALGEVTPFKEFIIKRDDASVATELARAKVLQSWRQSGGPLPKGICPNSFCKQAKTCSVVMECFGGKFH